VTIEDDDEQAAQPRPRKIMSSGTSGSPGRAGRRRRIPRARRRGGGQLRSTEIRRPVGDAICDGPDPIFVSGPSGFFLSSSAIGEKTNGRSHAQPFRKVTPCVQRCFLVSVTGQRSRSALG
jgi:hypothetical protein